MLTANGCCNYISTGKWATARCMQKGSKFRVRGGTSKVGGLLALLGLVRQCQNEGIIDRQGGWQADGARRGWKGHWQSSIRGERD